MVRFSNWVIGQILRGNKKSRHVFIDCVGADELPSSDQFPYAIAVNTDNSLEPGEHWTAIYVPSPSVVEYFDSFGLPPNENINSYLERFEIKQLSHTKFQSYRSTVCGAYCAYFILQRCDGVSWNRVMEKLSQTKDSDRLVREFCNSLF